MKKNFWLEYWSDKTSGMHRSSSEDFLQKEAREKLFHLAGGKSLLDFGCGSADLLVYYALEYEVCVGADSSQAMIDKAKERLRLHQLEDRVSLSRNDDVHIWDYLEKAASGNCRFERISAGQVIQYLDKKQVEHFISNALEHLTEEGKICLFDVVNERLYPLWHAGLFNYSDSVVSVVFRLLKQRLSVFKNHLLRRPVYDDGYLYTPVFFIELAKKYKLDVEFANSMYYEYRYHVFFTRSTAK